ncbi:hypothetical protein BH11MYX3_BH11MYX3_19290 [soil metagenome]
MALFHVYVEAPDPSPESIERLAETIGTKYGVPVAELAKRLTAGRFRVKANVDRVTADAYGKALAASGAVVKIEDALPTQPVPVITPPTGPRPSSSTLPPATAERSAGYSMQPAKERAASASLPPATRPATASLPPVNAERPASSSLPPATRPASASLPPTNADRSGLPRQSTPPPRASTSSLPPANTSRTSSASLPAASGSAKTGPVVATGLSAAYTESAVTDLGALGGDSLAMVSLEGDDHPRSASESDMFAPMPEVAPSVARTASNATKPPRPARPKDEPMDLFAPPDAAEDAAFKVEIAADDAAHRARKMSTPPAGVPATPPPVVTPQLKKKHPTPVAGHQVVVAPDAQETPRWRFAAGVMLSILLGFLPAHLIASSRERSAFQRIDAQVIATQDQADTAEMYATLDQFRDAQRAVKQSEKRNIALLSMLIWGIAAGGLAYVWFRRVPWDRITPNA